MPEELTTTTTIMRRVNFLFIFNILITRFNHLLQTLLLWYLIKNQ